MKFGLLVLVSCLLIPSFLVAQEDSTATQEKKEEIFITGGLAFPYLPSSLDVNYSAGTTFGAGYGYRFSPGSAGYSMLYAAAEYNYFKFDESSFLASADTNVLKKNPGLTATQRPLKAFTLTVNYQGTFTFLTEIISPYFMLGAGFIYLSVPPLITDPATTLEEPGYNKGTLTWSVGIGIDVPISESFGAFVQGKSVIAVLDDTHQYFPVNLGVRYTLP